MDYDNEDTRAFWSNAQTNEQHFGLLSFDRHKVRVNGTDDWEEGQVLYEKELGLMSSLTMDHDERYVYLKTEIEDMNDTFWERNNLEYHFSVRENEGIPVTANTDASLEILTDFRLTIENNESARIEVAGDYDSFFYDYKEFTEDNIEEIDSTFHPIRLALSKELVRPDTGEVLPFDSYETGELRFGIADPDHTDYDSLADYFYSEKTGILEVRIPWMLLNARDPSKKSLLGTSGKMATKLL